MPNKDVSHINLPVEQGTREISLHIFLGASKIDYPEAGGTLLSPGFGSAFTFSYFFMPNWSFMLGGGLQLFNNRGTATRDFLDPFVMASDDSDDYGDNRHDYDIRLYYDFEDYKENQWSMMFMIPLMFQFQANEKGNKAFYAALGAKLGIPFAGDFQGSVSSAKLCGYYPSRDPYNSPPANFEQCREKELYTGHEHLGFGDFGAFTSSSKLGLSPALFAAAELGMKWRLYDKLAVYTGFWLDWALNDVSIKNNIDKPFNWEPFEGYPADSDIPQAKLTFNSRTAGKAIPISFGFTFRLAFGVGTLNPVPDSLRWIGIVEKRDSVINDRDANIARLRQDSLALVPEEEILAYLEKRQQDSVVQAWYQATEKAERFAALRQKLSSFENNLDGYSVTRVLIDDRAREKLDFIAELIHDYPELTVRIVGHTCDRGTHEANIKLGLQRAQSAMSYLVTSKGISAERLRTESQAGLEPLIPNEDEASRLRNRRVQLIVEGIEEPIIEETEALETIETEEPTEENANVGDVQ
jgi:outer membrane protein OmpA-like peptidoglycan-associated protein